MRLRSGRLSMRMLLRVMKIHVKTEGIFVRYLWHKIKIVRLKFGLADLLSFCQCAFSPTLSRFYLFIFFHLSSENKFPFTFMTSKESDIFTFFGLNLLHFYIHSHNIYITHLMRPHISKWKVTEIFISQMCGENETRDE